MHEKKKVQLIGRNLTGDATAIGKATPEALIVFEMPYNLKKASSLII